MIRCSVAFFRPHSIIFKRRGGIYPESMETKKVSSTTDYLLGDWFVEPLLKDKKSLQRQEVSSKTRSLFKDKKSLQRQEVSSKTAGASLTICWFVDYLLVRRLCADWIPSRLGAAPLLKGYYSPSKDTIATLWPLHVERRNSIL